jgi:hypothetical protein
LLLFAALIVLKRLFLTVQLKYFSSLNICNTLTHFFHLNAISHLSASPSSSGVINALTFLPAVTDI